jgi:disulfide oxidoreductase YuzD
MGKIGKITSLLRKAVCGGDDTCAGCIRKNKPKTCPVNYLESAIKKEIDKSLRGTITVYSCRKNINKLFEE